MHSEGVSQDYMVVGNNEIVVVKENVYLDGCWKCAKTWMQKSCGE